MRIVSRSSSWQPGALTQTCTHAHIHTHVHTHTVDKDLSYKEFIKVMKSQTTRGLEKVEHVHPRLLSRT